ncbi:MAG: ABC transporter permease [Desulfurococcales archaeon]|nr:ABC transporter permease [Desulfurococcales archaeon]
MPKKESIIKAINMIIIKNSKGLAGISIVLFFVFMAILAPYMAPYDPYAVVGKPLQPPSPQHWLGTNDIGQDIWSEVLYGSRTSLLVGLTAPFIAALIALVLGLLAGYKGGVIDELISGAIDIMLALPTLPLIIILAAYLGPSLLNIILILAFFGWAGGARVFRAQVMSLRSREYVEAARALGASGMRIMFIHILPSLTPIILADIVMGATSAILTEAGLSFLGLGDPTVKSWGQILRHAQASYALQLDLWLWIFVPGLFIALLGTGFALIGFAIEEYVNPRIRQKI